MSVQINHELMLGSVADPLQFGSSMNDLQKMKEKGILK